MSNQPDDDESDGIDSDEDETEVTLTCNRLVHALHVSRRCITSFPTPEELAGASECVKKERLVIVDRLKSLQGERVVLCKLSMKHGKENPTSWTISVMCQLSEFYAQLLDTLKSRTAEAKGRLNTKALKQQVLHLETLVDISMRLIRESTIEYTDPEMNRVDVRKLQAELASYSNLPERYVKELEDVMNDSLKSIQMKHETAKKTRHDSLSATRAADANRQNIANIDRLAREKIDLQNDLERQVLVSDHLVDVVFNAAVTAFVPVRNPVVTLTGYISEMPPHTRLQAWVELLFKPFNVKTHMQLQLDALTTEIDLVELRRLARLALHTDKCSSSAMSSSPQWGRLMGQALSAFIASVADQQ